MFDIMFMLQKRNEAARLIWITSHGQFIWSNHSSNQSMWAKRSNAQLNIPLCGRALRSVAHGQSKYFRSRSPVNQIPLRSRSHIKCLQ